jgi:hypothetical protein
VCLSTKHTENPQQKKREREEQRQMKELIRRKLVVLVVILSSVIMANAAMGADYDPCYEAYLESGLTNQQMSFGEFNHSYSDTLCAKEGHNLQATREESRWVSQRQQSPSIPQNRKEKEQMIKVAIEVHSGAARMGVTVQAQSIERALSLVGGRFPGKPCRVKFPMFAK